MASPPEPPGRDDEGPSPPAERESGADRLARRMREEHGDTSSPPATEKERETFVSLLGYHYGAGTIDAEDFSHRMELVHHAGTLAELYELTADLPFPPPLAELSGHQPVKKRRRWFQW